MIMSNRKDSRTIIITIIIITIFQVGTIEEQ